MHIERQDIGFNIANFYDFSRKYYYIWTGVFLVAVVDLITTYIGLQIGLVETNPFGVFLLENIGYIGLVLFKFSIIGIYLIISNWLPNYWSYMPPIILFIVWLFVSVNNVVHLFYIL